MCIPFILLIFCLVTGNVTHVMSKTYTDEVVVSVIVVNIKPESVGTLALSPDGKSGTLGSTKPSGIPATTYRRHLEVLERQNE